jgi:hypothetical protein
MSAEVILLLLGAVLLLLALIDGLRSSESSPGLMSNNLRVPMGILGFCLLIYAGFAYGAFNPQGQIEQAAIGNKKEITTPVDRTQVISPLEGDVVKCRRY